LTKNPEFYRLWWWHIPEHTILGATMETDLSISNDISRAPPPSIRIKEMIWVKDNLPNDRFICTEPIMKMSPMFEHHINLIKPKLAAVGYDGYNHHLPEPTLARTEDFFKALEDAGIKVFRKRIRKAWDEK
ncbi:MAG: hypothetical protein KAV87_43485, partial [Desulfobacteraceae bacterium]|nr:hypothetical protein [Desulfobacteraceae bacterium]